MGERETLGVNFGGAASHKEKEAFPLALLVPAHLELEGEEREERLWETPLTHSPYASSYTSPLGRKLSSLLSSSGGEREQ